MSPERIVLVGFMGAGKSRVGAALARRLGWRFRDLDDWIAERSGQSVPELFRSRGEAAFREQELRAAEALAGERELVVASGGGAFAQPATRAALQSGALSVWLRCSLDTCLARIGDGRGRPLAADREKIRALFDERQASYGLAELAIDTDEAVPDQTAERVAGALAERLRAAGGRRGRCGT